MECALSKANVVVAFSDSLITQLQCRLLQQIPQQQQPETIVITPAVFVTSNTPSPITSQLVAISKNPFLLLVTGFRPVKDPCFLLSVFCDYNIANSHCCDVVENLIVVGPILDVACYAEFVEVRFDCCCENKKTNKTITEISSL
jgi:hypothetical protein